VKTIIDMKPREPEIRLPKCWEWIPPFFDALMSAHDDDEE